MASDKRFSRRRVLISGAAGVPPFVAGCSGILGDSGGTQQTVETTFEGGKEGWTAVDLTPHNTNSDPDWTQVVQTLDVTHEQEGGVDGSGYIKHRDTTENAFFFTAPDEYGGDKSDFAGGQLRFSLRSSHNNYRLDSGVVLAGTDGVIVTQFSEPGSNWTEFTIELNADSRTYRETNLNGPEVGQGRVEEILSNLQALRISGEHASRVEEVVGLDEVRLLPP